LAFASGLLGANGVEIAHADYYDGLRAFDRGDTQGALDEWKKSALAGDVMAQKRLGDTYRSGRTVLQDFAEAYTWYSLASINALKVGADGVVPLELKRVKDEAVAARDTLRSLMIEDDLDQARRTIVNLYEKRGPRGLFELGELYRNGRGLPLNPVEAYRYFVIAAFQGIDDAALARDALVPRLQPAQIAAAQRAAASWRSSVDGQPAGPIKPKLAPAIAPAPAVAPIVPKEAMLPAPPQPPSGGLHAEPDLVLLEPVQANVVTLAGAPEDARIVQQALRTLRFYRGGLDGDFGVKTAKAISAFQRSIRASRTGQLSTGQLERLMLRAAGDRDDAIAQLNLGRMLISGRYLERNPDRAIRYYKRSAAQGVAEASYQLGVIYRDAIGVAADPALAAFHFREAQKRRHPKASQALRSLS
jgi:TPR repeat protein